MAQNWEVKIQGTFTEMNSSKPIPNVSIFLQKNSDTISSTLTDSLGFFSIVTNFTMEDEYILNYKYNNRYIPKNVIHKSKDTSQMEEYFFEMGLFLEPEFKCDLCEFYDFNKTRKKKNYDLDWFKKFMDEYPDFCYKFIQKNNPKETERIAKKRMRNFIKALENMQCDMTRIKFSDEILYLDENMLKIDSRSRMEGSIISVEGNCN